MRPEHIERIVGESAHVAFCFLVSFYFVREYQRINTPFLSGSRRGTKRPTDADESGRATKVKVAASACFMMIASSTTTLYSSNVCFILECIVCAGLCQQDTKVQRKKPMLFGWKDDKKLLYCVQFILIFI
jgi:hypothetical protein